MNRDDALMELYGRLASRNAPKVGSFSALSSAERTAYFTSARRRNRAKERAMMAAGAPAPTTANIRAALADAALMILAIDADGADLVREVLAGVFTQRAGVPMAVERKARTGRLRPKLAKLPEIRP
jgi:hypothetical protein